MKIEYDTSGNLCPRCNDIYYCDSWCLSEAMRDKYDYSDIFVCKECYKQLMRENSTDDNHK